MSLDWGSGQLYKFSPGVFFPLKTFAGPGLACSSFRLWHNRRHELEMDHFLARREGERERLDTTTIDVAS